MIRLLRLPAALPAATLTLLAASPLAVAADLRLPSLFSNGMVLQRGADVAVWGWADPGEEVAVRGGWMAADAAPVRARANDAGRWELTLRTPQDAGKTTLTVRAASGSVALEDVSLGEVWLCSGQSNMEWLLQQTVDAAGRQGVTPEALANLDRPEVRYFRVPRRTSTEPLDECGGSWRPAVGDDALGCSSVAYFFACAVQEELDVPIGLVVTAWGGTPAQAWTSEEVVSRFPDHAESLEAIRGIDDSGQGARVAEFWDRVEGLESFTARFREAAFDDGHWDEQVQPAFMEGGPVGEHDGVVWYRRTVDVPEGWLGEDLELQLPAIDDMDQTFWNGEPIGTTVVRGGHALPRRYRVPADELRPGVATIAIRALDTGGPGGFGEGPMRLVRGEEFLDLSGPWRVRKGVAANQIPAAPFPVTADQNSPAALFNGMLAPLIPFTVQGVLWYQGESNRTRAREYRALFPAMIVDWRTRWEQPELPFYLVQIAPFNYREQGSEDSMIAQLREAQELATRLPGVGMALTADIGDPRDIHPLNKWDVGRRLARFALRNVYGNQEIEPYGPSVEAVTRDGNGLRVSFSHVGDGLRMRGESLDHFELAGADGRFVPAIATLGPDGASVIVRAEGVTLPAKVRYLWSDAAGATLMGGHGLPAAPFRREL